MKHRDWLNFKPKFFFSDPCIRSMIFPTRHCVPLEPEGNTSCLYCQYTDGSSLLVFWLASYRCKKKPLYLFRINAVDRWITCDIIEKNSLRKLIFNHRVDIQLNVLLLMSENIYITSIEGDAIDRELTTFLSFLQLSILTLTPSRKSFNRLSNKQ